MRIYLNKVAWEKHCTSPFMYRLRQQVKERDGFKCVRCGSKRRLECHHITYHNVPHERPADLITLCRKCHLFVDRSKSGKHFVRWILSFLIS